MNTDVRTQFHSDSFKKDVTCPQCGEEFHGELYRWEDGEEECPHCDHVFYVEATEDAPSKTIEDALPHELIDELISRKDIEILESYGPCEGSFQVLELVKKLRELLATNE
jgi:uncharacterized Zn finger protein (UPF0148 family)